ncbi:TRPM8 channel-associated factor homolog [Salarias fasciatus]|uniref:TRPM8 channel-associated factor homolog n=1 Tax=Salarias fasciatus TaxID=181472 RepID=A0A672IV32_SALFA|nr:TRPM8 channel-associated factor homolog [Salarias fasciatus]XP_029964014.1 TRPM8 channel-associated factor homolog [Salarias fasciatus]XP_029964016.1 TRPM8 channel-associated factor homolog [Salarias fasciatus]XP_029964017.1 TRPM8 channel-associated factor homolog [Salarias fasciatus]XP_029964018.1 TRPM8 channel-associated factor homolog [Salarias fasciatus]
MSHQPTQNQHEEAYLSITKGLRELDLRAAAVPCDLVLIGDHAFPIAMNSQGQVLMAASFYGKGRIVVMGHEGYLHSFPDVVKNAVTWLRGDGSNNLSVGVHNNLKAVADNLQKSGFQAGVVGGFSDKLGAGVYVTDAYSVGNNPKDLVAFMRDGGGVLIAGQAWHWASAHGKDKTLHHFDGNKVAGVAGIYFSDHAAEKENLPVYPQIPSSWMAVVLGKDFEDDLRFLLQGISEFDIPNGITASEILVHGPLAFPIGCTNDKQAFLAGGYYGQGRVIVASHEGLLKLEEMAPFWKNALLWLDEGRNGVVGAANDQIRKVLGHSGLKCEKTDFKRGLSVFVSPSSIDKHADEILDFVAEGGGLLVGGHAWWWAQTHKDQSPLVDFPGNKVLNQMGLSLLGSTLKGGKFKAPNPSQALKDMYHFRHHLHRFACHVNVGEKLTKHEEDCLRKLSHDCSTYLRMKAHDCSSYTQVVSILTDLFKKSGMPQVSDSCPIKNAKDQVLLHMGTELYKVCKNPDELLPCLIKDNPLLPVVYNYKITVDVNTAGGEEWISSGLYLSPGMKTYIAIPKEIVNKGWKIQIGCQTDTLKSNELKRAPSVHERFPVSSEMMLVWNLWGGLIYLVAPPKTQVQGVEAIVQMAVPAPYYKCGVTTAEQWALLRTAPSPWAELEFENIILTVPSEVIRSLDRPDKLQLLWDEIMRGIADLAAVPHKFVRKERFVADVQISHGFMHAGYPVMTHKSSAAALVNVEGARTKGMWGAIHELGHNQQRGSWEFPPHTTEATCNLWSVYVHEEVLNLKREKVHNAVKPENRSKRIEGYVKGGRKLSDWSMWTALETYLQLQGQFGWDAFKKVFAAYQKMTNIPKDKHAKMNLYAETFSQTVGMNLCGFFQAWGWPIEADTEQKLSNLPPWSDHPLVRFG